MVPMEKILTHIKNINIIMIYNIYIRKIQKFYETSIIQ